MLNETIYMIVEQNFNDIYNFVDILDNVDELKDKLNKIRKDHLEDEFIRYIKDYYGDELLDLEQINEWLTDDLIDYFYEYINKGE